MVERIEMTFGLRRPMARRPMMANGTIPPIIDRIEVAAAFESGLLAVEARWPDAPVNADEFAAYVRERVSAQRDLSAMLPRFRVDDLFLAWWAMTSSDGMVAFEAEFGDDLLQIIARFPRLDAAELIRTLRLTLFAGDEPRIAEFSGFGSLRSWLDVVATRTFLDAARL